METLPALGVQSWQMEGSQCWRLPRGEAGALPGGGEHDHSAWLKDAQVQPHMRGRGIPGRGHRPGTGLESRIQQTREIGVQCVGGKSREVRLDYKRS